MRNRITFYLNGERCDVVGEQAGWMLADYLRYARSLTGTKIVCAEGDCGACTVLRWFPTEVSPKPAFVPINACIFTVAQMDGSSVITIDALAHPKPTQVQRALASGHGSQCGFCTPGFVMALTGLVEARPKAKSLGLQETKNALTGNLCRCTGYQPILEAACKLDPSRCESLAPRFVSAAQIRELRKLIRQPVRVDSEDFSFFAPRTLKEAARELSRHPDARLLAGGTDLGVVHNKRKQRLARTVSLHLIPELYRVSRRGKRVRVGARVTLTELRHAIRASVPELARFLDLFASPQIKNVATLAGNLANGSPIADTPPFLLVAGATQGVVGPRASRTIKIENFYQGYRKLALKRGELIRWVEFDIPAKSETLGLTKVSQRKDLDISTVNAAFRARWKKSRGIAEMRIALGGVAATPIRLPRTEAALVGKFPDRETVANAMRVLREEIAPISDLRGSAAFRRIVAENLLSKFFRDLPLA